jgi:hypothetical protein
MIVASDDFLMGYRKRIVELAERYWLPAVNGVSIFIAEGGLARPDRAATAARPRLRGDRIGGFLLSA